MQKAQPWSTKCCPEHVGTRYPAAVLRRAHSLLGGPQGRTGKGAGKAVKGHEKDSDGQPGKSPQRGTFELRPERGGVS